MRGHRRAALAAVFAAAALWAGAPVRAADGPAADDAYSVAEDAPGGLVVPVDTGLLANDTGGSAVLCVATVDTTSLIGTLDQAGRADGSFTYTPPANFAGTTSFGYSVATTAGGTCPSALEGSAVATITVTPVNDPPNAVADFFSALADRTLTIAPPGVLANDTDVDGDALSAVLVNDPAHGTLTLAANGGFSYTPAAGYTGVDIFTYRASDGAAQSAIRAVNINVSAIPTPTPAPQPTPAPTAAPTASPEPSPSESPEPSDSGPVTAAPSDSGLSTASPSPGPVVGPVAGQGGPPLLAIGALALLLGLLAVAAVFFVRGQGGDGGGDLDLEPEFVDSPYGDEEPGPN